MCIIAPERWVAYHEAGHGVAVHSKGLEVLCLTIIPDGRIRGLCSFIDPYSTFSDLNRPAYLQKELVCCIAGSAALVHLFCVAEPSQTESPETVQASITELAKQDLSDIAEIKKKLIALGRDPEECERQAAEECRKLVETNWNAIDKLARELLVAKTLGWREVRATIKRAQQH